MSNDDFLKSYEKCASFQEVLSALSKNKASEMMVWQKQEDGRSIYTSKNWEVDYDKERLKVYFEENNFPSFEIKLPLYFKLPFREAILKSDMESFSDGCLILKIPSELFWREFRQAQRIRFSAEEKSAFLRPLNQKSIHPEGIKVFLKDISSMGIGIVVSDRDEKHFKKGDKFETLSVDQFSLESHSLVATVVYKIREKKYGNLAGVWHRIGIRMSAPFPDELIQKYREIDLTTARPRSIDFLSEDFKIAIEQEIQSTQKKIKNNSAVAKYLLKLDISRQKDQYISEHVKVLSYISTYIARSMNWITDLTMQKLIYASHLHDAPLIDHPHLARLIYLKDFEKIKGKLSTDEQNIYLSAPQEAYLIVLDDKKAPPDVDVMLLMQKELPNGKGFPKKHNSTKITPMAAVFIVAHDLAHEMVTNPEWSIDEWIGRVKPIYKGGSFTKVMDAIETHRFAFKK